MSPVAMLPFGDGEAQLPVVPADGVEIAALIEVVDGVARPCFRFALEERHEVVAVEMDLEVLAAGLRSLPSSSP